MCSTSTDAALEETLTMAQAVPMNAVAERQRAMRIMAKAIFKNLKEDGFDNKDAMALSSELLGLITTDLREAR
jgi:hypothetical protein